MVQCVYTNNIPDVQPLFLDQLREMTDIRLRNKSLSSISAQSCQSVTAPIHSYGARQNLTTCNSGGYHPSTDSRYCFHHSPLTIINHLFNCEFFKSRSTVSSHAIVWCAAIFSTVHLIIYSSSSHYHATGLMRNQLITILHSSYEHWADNEDSKYLSKT